MPLGVEEGSLKLACSDPFCRRTQDELNPLLDSRIERCLRCGR